MISVGNNKPLTTAMPNVEANKTSNPQNDGYKRITKGQIKDILATPQVMRSDCYLVSTLKSLAKSRHGKQMLKNSIKTSPDGDTFEIQFKKYGENGNYGVQNDNAYKASTGRHQFNPTGAVERATNELVQDKTSSKPILLRMFAPLFCEETPVECNLASVYMENLTGKKPISIGDDCLLPLSHKKEEATKLLDEIGDKPMNKHSFVAGSKLAGTKDGIGSMHYYVVKKVDKDKKEVHLVNPRYVDLSKGTIEKDIETDMIDELPSNTEMANEILNQTKDNLKKMPKVYKLSYEQFMKNFRSLVGYFDEKGQK